MALRDPPWKEAICLPTLQKEFFKECMMSCTLERSHLIAIIAARPSQRKHSKLHTGGKLFWVPLLQKYFYRGHDVLHTWGKPLLSAIIASRSFQWAHFSYKHNKEKILVSYHWEKLLQKARTRPVAHWREAICLLPFQQYLFKDCIQSYTLDRSCLSAIIAEII